MASAAAPHVVFVLADDVGVANVGWNNDGGGAIRTPHLDALRGQGVELLNFYTHFSCSPSRAALLSGRLPAHVNLGLDPPTIANTQDDMGGCQGIPRNMTTLAERLTQVGYRTVVIGKWDVGMCSPQHTPKGRGFQRSLTFFHHGVDYYSGVGGRLCPHRPDARPSIPVVDLWETDEATGTEGPARRRGHSTRPYVEHLFADEAVTVIKDHAAERPAQPLFLLYASHLVHLPHQVPRAQLETLSGVAPMARRVTAAMMALLDEVVGRLRSALEEGGMWENTLFVFCSDNGGHTRSGTCH